MDPKMEAGSSSNISNVKIQEYPYPSDLSAASCFKVDTYARSEDAARRIKRKKQMDPKMEAGSSSNISHVVKIQEYPYPSDLSAASCFISVRLSGRDKYRMWRAQMLCLLDSHDMLGFINGTLKCPETRKEKVRDHQKSLWTLVRTSVFGKEKVGDHKRTWRKLVRTETSVSGKEKVGDNDVWDQLEKVGDNERPWRRSDVIVKGWILGSLSEQTLGYVLDHIYRPGNAYIPAKDVWDQLEKSYGPLDPTPPLALVPPHSTVHSLETAAYHLGKMMTGKDRAELHQNLYMATLRQDLDEVDSLLGEGEVTVIDQISNNGNTALHAAVNNTEFLKKLLEKTPDNTDLLDVRNSDGSTLLHVASIVDNPEAVDILVARNRGFLVSEDYKGHTPLFIALSNMHSKTVERLLGQLSRVQEKLLFSGASGEELLVAFISAKGFSTAERMLTRYPDRATHSDAVLMSVVQNYPCELNMWEEFIENDTILYEGILTRGKEVSDTVEKYMVDRCVPVCGSWVERIIKLFGCGIYMIISVFPAILIMLGFLFIKKKLLAHNDARDLLSQVCKSISSEMDFSTYHNYYTNPILEATRLNLPRVVQSIVSNFANAISSANQDGHNIIQYAVISRSEKVYNLIYQMTGHKNVYRTIRDSSDNNLLHLAGRLAPANKLKFISGAALQIQRELQWFKEVERFVCLLNITQKNCFCETPQMVFTREHKDLVIEGEKWLKATAESYTITAALIITIVFAAAITVPGGNKDTGMPIFTHDNAFKIFAISDAISLFEAVTSLLMFLSILTARFAEQDFLFKLPTKLIIGLATLFISTTAMIIAFGATLYLVFGQSNSRILIPIAVLTCLPITCFVTLQFPLVLDLVSATYGRSIFGKKKDDLFY